MNDDRLYRLHADAVKELESGPQFNWILNFDCDAQDLHKLEITDVVETAKGWRSEVPPPEFYFTHAQYYTDGIKHIINELKEKPTSNRALYSLIAQDHIRNSGDTPIPSFMTLQCQIDKDILYCTCYFRALEASTFLKINLEEIRQTLVEIYEGIPQFAKVHLTIFAFRAYNDPGRLPLRRPRLETLTVVQLVELLLNPEGNPIKTLRDMLNELHGAVTAVSDVNLIALKDILSSNVLQTLKWPGKPLFINQLERAIAATAKLAALRKKGSHGPGVDEAIQSYQQDIKALCDNLDN